MRTGERLRPVQDYGAGVWVQPGTLMSGAKLRSRQVTHPAIGAVVMLIGHDRSNTNLLLRHFTGRFTDASFRSIQTLGSGVFEPVEVVLVHRGSSHDPDVLLEAQLNELVAVDQIDRWVSTKGSPACWF
jgi:hypothetical protein